MPHNDTIITLDSHIENIIINDSLITLSAPIRLSGRLNVSALDADIASQTQAPLLQIGVDEAGRGPLLGSVNVAAAILPSTWSGLIEDQPLCDTPLSILTDSKKLSEKKRDLLYPIVQAHAIGHIIADVPAPVIDQLNILQATMLGMRVCSEALIQALAIKLAGAPIKLEILYDGNRCPALPDSVFIDFGIPRSAVDCQAWVKGDGRHTSMAAASVLAKVSRDEVMYALDTQYPHYGIAKHKGYPTAAHVQAISEYGVLPEHRRSFAPIKKALASR